MSVRHLLPTVLLLAAVSAGCTESPTQAEGTGTVTVTETTSTSTSTSTTTTSIPDLIPGGAGLSPAGTGLAFATVFTFSVAPPSGGVEPYTFTWNFGDGQTGAGPAPSHTYTNTGSFVAIATATDARGKTAQSSVPVSIRAATGRWTATFGAFNPEPIDIVQNQTAVTVTINDTLNALGFASGTGAVSNPKSLSISATFTTGVPFAVTYVGRMDDTLMKWTGTVTGYAGCPCPFTATRPSAGGDLSVGHSPASQGR